MMKADTIPDAGNIARPEWAEARRIVVKLGSALLTETGCGSLKTDWLESLVEDVVALRAEGKEVVLVSSGSIALGRQVLELPAGPLALEHGQAAAAVGQVGLTHTYRNLFGDHFTKIAQILLTLGDTEERRRYLNARQTLQELLKLGVVPIVNENDTVATNEIRYGDNDRLSARVASMVSADCLVLLSDVDGLYTAPPGTSENAHRLDVVPEITREIEAMAGDAGTELSKGGMKTKIEAARIACAAGAHMVIASGKVQNPLRAIAEGCACTWFLATSDPVAAKKKWISGQLEPSGSVTLDAGAVRALKAGKSLLPAGVTEVSGTFDRGDAVVIRSHDGEELGRGLVAYANEDAARIIGKQSSEIFSLLGFAGRDELIHRGDMALTAASLARENNKPQKAKKQKRNG